MHRDDAKRQHKRHDCRQEQHHAVDTVERLLSQQQPVEQVEHGYQHSHLGIVYQKVKHSLSP